MAGDSTDNSFFISYRRRLDHLKNQDGLSRSLPRPSYRHTGQKRSQPNRPGVLEGSSLPFSLNGGVQGLRIGVVEALFDLALGSLFHEAMKLRESLYQRDVYGPRVALLREAADEESEALIVEFDRILGKSVSRQGEVVAEVRVLLAQTRDQLRRLLLERAGDRRVTRCLLSRKAQVDGTFPEGLSGLLQAMHGNTVTGLIEGARALLESAYYIEALETLRQAQAEPDAPAGEIRQLELYAEGMQAVLDGRYAHSIETLTAWADQEGHVLEREFARLASSVLGRLGPLLRDDPDAATWVARAKALNQRIDGVSG